MYSPNILRHILAIVAAAFTNLLVVSLAERLNERAFPLPAGVDPRNTDQISAALQAGPQTVFVGVLVGILLASFLSGLVASLIAQHARRVVLIVGAMLLLGNIANAFSFWHPIWFRLAAILLPLPLALAGSWLVSRNSRLVESF